MITTSAGRERDSWTPPKPAATRARQVQADLLAGEAVERDPPVGDDLVGEPLRVPAGQAAGAISRASANFRNDSVPGRQIVLTGNTQPRANAGGAARGGLA
jgi:hypothetical protein